MKLLFILFETLRACVLAGTPYQKFGYLLLTYAVA